MGTRDLKLKIAEAPDGARPGFRITMTEAGEKVGEIVVRQHRWLPGKPFAVENIYVTRMRQRLGTQLYKAASVEACSRGFPFMSDMDRSAEADGFWKKQERLGRVARKTTPLGDDEVDYYLMDCPSSIG